MKRRRAIQVAYCYAVILLFSVGGIQIEGEEDKRPTDGQKFSAPVSQASAQQPQSDLEISNDSLGKASDKEEVSEEKASGTVEEGHQLLAVAPPPFSEEVFPCSDCHDVEDEVDVTPTKELFHDEIHFEHDPDNLWCYSCHNVGNRDEVHLSNGKLIPFTESYLLCGQCHGTQLRDWRAGDHGKRTGSWSGTKEYLLCAHCHSPHSPKIKPIKPLPPPIRQENIR